MKNLILSTLVILLMSSMCIAQAQDDNIRLYNYYSENTGEFYGESTKFISSVKFWYLFSVDNKPINDSSLVFQITDQINGVTYYSTEYDIVPDTNDLYSSVMILPGKYIIKIFNTSGKLLGSSKTFQVK